MSASRRVIFNSVLYTTVLVFPVACDRLPAETVVVDVTRVEDRIARVAEGLQQPLVLEGHKVERWNIDERMDKFQVPAVSVAVIDGGELAWSRAWGVVENGSDQPVTTDTIFQAGSVSKPVAALLALSLVGDGYLDLDRPVNDILKSWKIPDNEFTRAEPVTLRHVITHQGGFTPFSYLMQRDQAKVPGMAELLAGGINDWPVVQVEFVPGSKHAYSNAGYCVLQLVLEESSSLSLHQLASRKMFGLLKMNHSHFDEPLSAELLATAASGHQRRRTGEGQQREALPVPNKAEIAPGATGGMWSTPTDLARVAIEVMRAWNGESDRLISTEVARQFLTPEVENQGLGISVEGSGSTLRAQHGGQMVGFICNMIFYPNTGQGAVLMSNSDGGRWVQQELLAAIAHEYDWPGHPVRRTAREATPEELQELVGVYSLDASPKTTFTVEMDGSVARGRINQYPNFELTPTTDPDLYVLPRESLEIVFRRGEDGSIAGVTLRRAGSSGNSYSRQKATT
jgi:CubicO group peptidase (beta-lactamase class C family)